MARVEDLHLMGATNVAIAEALTKAGIPCVEGTVRNDIERLRTVWRERVGDNSQANRDRAVMHYRRIQRAAWQEFQSVKDTSLNKSAYLNTVKGAEDSISKVLGIEAPAKHDFSGNLSVNGAVKHTHDVSFSYDDFAAAFADATGVGPAATDDPGEPLDRA